MFGRLGLGLVFGRKARAYLAFLLTAGSLPAGVTLTRASVAQYRNAGGQWTSAAIDAPRFSYRWTGTSWSLGGLLVEAAATNLALQSRDLSNASWTKAGGSATAGRFTEDSSTGNHYLRQTIAYVSGSVYCLSVEAGEVAGSPKRYLTMNLGAGAFGGKTPAVKFDLAAGTVTHSSGGATGIIQAAGPGKWLCSIVATATATLSTVADIRLHGVAATSGLTYTGNGLGALDISEIQMEVGSKPTSRIPTTTATVARSADVVTVNWGSRGVADGSVNVRYSFADAVPEVAAMTVSGGVGTVPTSLQGRFIRQIQKA